MGVFFSPAYQNGSIALLPAGEPLTLGSGSAINGLRTAELRPSNVALHPNVSSIPLAIVRPEGQPHATQADIQFVWDGVLDVLDMEWQLYIDGEALEEHTLSFTPVLRMHVPFVRNGVLTVVNKSGFEAAVDVSGGVPPYTLQVVDPTDTVREHPSRMVLQLGVGASNNQNQNQDQNITVSVTDARGTRTSMAMQITIVQAPTQTWSVAHSVVMDGASRYVGSLSSNAGAYHVTQPQCPDAHVELHVSAREPHVLQVWLHVATPVNAAAPLTLHVPTDAVELRLGGTTEPLPDVQQDVWCVRPPVFTPVDASLVVPNDADTHTVTCTVSHGFPGMRVRAVCEHAVSVSSQTILEPDGVMVNPGDTLALHLAVTLPPREAGTSPTMSTHVQFHVIQADVDWSTRVPLILAQTLAVHSDTEFTAMGTQTWNVFHAVSGGLGKVRVTGVQLPPDSPLEWDASISSVRARVPAVTATITSVHVQDEAGQIVQSQPLTLHMCALSTPGLAPGTQPLRIITDNITSATRVHIPAWTEMLVRHPADAQAVSGPRPGSDVDVPPHGTGSVHLIKLAVPRFQPWYEDTEIIVAEVHTVRASWSLPSDTSIQALSIHHGTFFYKADYELRVSHVPTGPHALPLQLHAPGRRMMWSVNQPGYYAYLHEVADTSPPLLPDVANRVYMAVSGVADNAFDVPVQLLYGGQPTGLVAMMHVQASMNIKALDAQPVPSKSWAGHASFVLQAVSINGKWLSPFSMDRRLADVRVRAQVLVEVAGTKYTLRGSPDQLVPLWDTTSQHTQTPGATWRSVNHMLQGLPDLLVQASTSQAGSPLRLAPARLLLMVETAPLVELRASHGAHHVVAPTDRSSIHISTTDDGQRVLQTHTAVIKATHASLPALDLISTADVHSHMATFSQ